MNLNILGYSFQGPHNYLFSFENTFSCVYAIVSSNNTLVYVGQTNDINERLRNHHKMECWNKNASSTSSLYVYVENNEEIRKKIEQEVLNVCKTYCNG